MRGIHQGQEAHGFQLKAGYITVNRFRFNHPRNAPLQAPGGPYMTPLSGTAEGVPVVNRGCLLAHRGNRAAGTASAGL